MSVLIGTVTSYQVALFEEHLRKAIMLYLIIPYP